MIKVYFRQILAVLIFCAVVASGQAASRCGICDDRLPQSHWTYGNTLCCSQSCVDQLRPHCSICNTVLRGEYIKSSGKIYCSNACLDQTLPKCEICKTPIRSGFSITAHNYCESCAKEKPTCFSCGLPAAYPTQLKDGREICNNCRRWAVTSQEMAQKHYERSLRYLQAWTSLELETVPKLELIDRTTMQEHSKSIRKTDEPVSIRGLYSRQTFMTKKGVFGQWKASPDDTQETIYIVDHLHDEVFRVAAVHEFMHDLIHEQFPRLKDAPLWVHEGICQQAAAEYCRRRNYADTLQGIAECTDPDYGDGYRYIKSVAGYEGWNALRRWMETVDVSTLPETAPKR